MGIMSFIKGAGSKLFGGSEETNTSTLDQIDVAEVQREAAEAMRAEANLADAAKLKNMVGQMGFETTNFEVNINEDTATITGEVETQSTKEKLILLVGNTAGIAQVDDQMTVVVQEPEARFHTVASGDTLGKIAKTYYGNAGKYPQIFDANKPMLTSPDNIYPGQVLRIPNIN